jgi:hypothetical protein
MSARICSGHSGFLSKFVLRTPIENAALRGAQSQQLLESLYRDGVRLSAAEVRAISEKSDPS